MSVRVVRLGTPRSPGEGTRIGTVRRPPRGVPKAQFSAQDWYDVWFPNLAPSVETMKLGQAARSPSQWAAFAKKYRAEMASPEARHDLELLAALSHTTNFSVGCYCEHEDRCHRSVLRQLLVENGANVVSSAAGESWPRDLDALVAAPEHHTLLFENATVRVLDARIPAGGRTPVHVHRWPSVLYVIGWSAFVRRDADGQILLDSRSVPALSTPPGVVWSPPLAAHSLENIGKVDLRVISVELKNVDA